MYFTPRHGQIKPYGLLQLDRNHPYTKYCVGAWFMQDGPTPSNITDISKYANIGAPQATPTIITGTYGKELLLNGSTQYVSVPSNNDMNPDASKAITILSRVKSTAIGGGQVVICKQFDGTNLPYMLNIGGTGSAVENGMAVYTSGWSASGVTTDVRGDNKYHIVCGTVALNPTGTSTTLSYYLDGKLDSSVTTGNVPQAAATTIQIGNYSNVPWIFSGSIEFVIVLIGITLSARQIQDFAISPYQMLTLARTNLNFPVVAPPTNNVLSGFFVFQ